MEEIGQKIKKIRELRDLTQTYVAGKVGMTAAGYSKIELGITDVTVKKLQKIAKVLEVDIQQILNFDESRILNFPNSTITQNQNVVGYVNSQQITDQSNTDIISLLKDELTYTRTELKDLKTELKSVTQELNQLKEQNQTLNRKMAA